IYLLQRKATKVGAGLGKTTGWIHRMELKRKGVQMFSSCEYKSIDDQGLHLTKDGEPLLLDVDHVVVCAGQESRQELADQITGIPFHLIGGADKAAELDAKRAISQGTRLAAEL
ncbi:MAG: NADPH-dependent 2,4-dienoyl-CoA reductase, partial [Desulfobacteraceae bacterium]